ncbi:hypothetical protein ABGB12_30335 [Actinocorallia sp. B10E7]|uniref:hypothetical protein n=1 Tax=Actinocorallia sp. B10E7 TaxID=3153558 RepID=UPI00325E1282
MFDGLVRTFVPVAAGVLLTRVASYGLELPEAAVTDVLTVLVTAAYYALARLLERRAPRLGRALVSASLTSRTPVYTAGDGTP